jgi:hypothetical protein
MRDFELFAKSYPVKMHENMGWNLLNILFNYLSETATFQRMEKLRENKMAVHFMCSLNACVDIFERTWPKLMAVGNKIYNMT